MPTFTIDAPNGKSYEIDGPNADGALAALKKHLGGDAGTAPTNDTEAADHGLSERQQLSPLGKALSPITGYPATYQRMNQEARGQMSHGVDQMLHPGDLTTREGTGLSDILTGAGNVAAGAAGYVTSPINAAYRSIVGQPIEDTTGIPRELPEFAAQLATPGIGIAGASKGAGLVTKTVAKEAAPSIQELKTAAGKNYDSPALTGLEVKPSTISDFATKTKIQLNENGVDENLAPKTFAILDNLEKVPPGPSTIVTGNNIKSLRQLLGGAAGEPGKEGFAGANALKALDDHIPNIETKDVLAGDPKAAGQALDTANADYSAAMHAQTIDNKTIKAELRAAASNSGQNVANTVRQRFVDILDPEHPERQRGFTQDELSKMEEVIRGTKTQNALRYAGNYLGGGGGLGAQHMSAIGATAGAVVGGPAGAFVGATLPSGLGYILKGMGNRSTLQAAQQISEAIRSRAPLASSAAKFNQTAKAFSMGQNSQTYAAALIASRNLSNNLRGAGINISPTDLMKGLQSPSGAAADDQQQVPGPPAQ